MVDSICTLKDLLQVTNQVGGRLSPFMDLHGEKGTNRKKDDAFFFNILALSFLGNISKCQASDSSCSGHLRLVCGVHYSSPVSFGPQHSQHPCFPALVHPTGCCHKS